MRDLGFICLIYHSTDMPGSKIWFNRNQTMSLQLTPKQVCMLCISMKFEKVAATTTKFSRNYNVSISEEIHQQLGYTVFTAKHQRQWLKAARSELLLQATLDLSNRAKQMVTYQGEREKIRREMELH